MKLLTKRFVSMAISGMLAVGMIGGMPVAGVYAAGEAVASETDAETGYENNEPNGERPII